MITTTLLTVYGAICGILGIVLGIFGTLTYLHFAKRIRAKRLLNELRDEAEKQHNASTAFNKALEEVFNDV